MNIQLSQHYLLKTILFPLKGLCTLVVNQLTIDVSVFLDPQFFSVGMSVLRPILQSFFFFLMILFSFDCAVCCSLALSLVVASGSCSPVVVSRLLVAVASCIAEHVGSGVAAQGLRSYIEWT